MAAHCLAPVQGRVRIFTMPPPLSLQEAPDSLPFIISRFPVRWG